MKTIFAEVFNTETHFLITLEIELFYNLKVCFEPQYTSQYFAQFTKIFRLNVTSGVTQHLLNYNYDEH